MLIKLENELSKLDDIKKNIKEMGASLWQRSFNERTSRTRIKNARKSFLGRYKKSRRSNKRK